ncbi:hypothetical protein C5167_003467 [Papaver somniferum]|uniref:Uncharacterized protein n=1 Tax=Papaver somniferum TaxID=3469 RepID=A0A4Y7L2T4_PAPSO|nr:hypothetical protein C5167_003467 [Papaver somniferum]
MKRQEWNSASGSVRGDLFVIDCVIEGWWKATQNHFEAYQKTVSQWFIDGLTKYLQEGGVSNWVIVALVLAVYTGVSFFLENLFQRNVQPQLLENENEHEQSSSEHDESQSEQEYEDAHHEWHSENEDEHHEWHSENEDEHHESHSEDEEAHSESQIRVDRHDGTIEYYHFFYAAVHDDRSFYYSWLSSEGAHYFYGRLTRDRRQYYYAHLTSDVSLRETLSHHSATKSNLGGNADHTRRSQGRKRKRVNADAEDDTEFGFVSRQRKQFRATMH